LVSAEGHKYFIKISNNTALSGEGERAVSNQRKTLDGFPSVAHTSLVLKAQSGVVPEAGLKD
jgi:hypothetical protein